MQIPFKHDLQRRYSGIRASLRRVLLSAAKTVVGEGAASAKGGLHHALESRKRPVNGPVARSCLFGIQEELGDMTPIVCLPLVRQVPVAPDLPPTADFSAPAIHVEPIPTHIRGIVDRYLLALGDVTECDDTGTSKDYTVRFARVVQEPSVRVSAGDDVSVIIDLEGVLPQFLWNGPDPLLLPSKRENGISFRNPRCGENPPPTLSRITDAERTFRRSDPTR